MCHTQRPTGMRALLSWPSSCVCFAERAKRIKCRQRDSCLVYGVCVAGCRPIRMSREIAESEWINSEKPQSELEWRWVVWRCIPGLNLVVWMQSMIGVRFRCFSQLSQHYALRTDSTQVLAVDAGHWLRYLQCPSCCVELLSGSSCDPFWYMHFLHQHARVTSGHGHAVAYIWCEAVDLLVLIQRHYRSVLQLALYGI